MLSMTVPFFSVIIPSRNRAQLFTRALASVSCQDTQGKFEFEVVVVNDGCTEEESVKYKKIIDDYSGSIQSLVLRARENGHGPSFSRNEGAYLAKGQYLCFLDDDDVWTNESHLLSLFEHIKNTNSQENSLYLFQQLAETPDGKVLTESLWNRDIIENLSIDSYRIISPKDVANSAGFTHLNCLICAKSLFVKVGAFDEALRYEEDRDLYLRLVDNAQQITIFNKNVARHYIPDKQLSQNASSSLRKLDKLNMQIASDIKLLSKVKNSELKKSILKHLLFATREVAKTSQNKDSKIIFSKVAQSLQFSLKWFLYLLYLKLKP